MSEASVTPVASPRTASARRNAPAWRADVRFFLVCYTCGLIAFLVMLS